MNNDKITTKPTIETVLEKINTLGEHLTGQLTELRNGQDGLRSDVTVLRSDVAEVKAGQVELRNDMADLNVVQRKIVHKITILNDTILAVQTDLRADIRAFDRRLEKLESQPLDS